MIRDGAKVWRVEIRGTSGDSSAHPVIIGDSDIVRPEHVVEMFRLLGGGVPGDVSGLPRSQLAILPGTTHITVVERSAWFLSMDDSPARCTSVQSQLKIS